ncbi:hypothetical protein [Streptomyces sp. NPDC055749]
MSTPHNEGDVLPTEPAGGGKVTLLSLSVNSESLPEGKTITLDPATFVKSQPVTIKEGVEWNVVATFRVDEAIVSGLRYVHVVKRAGVKVDKLEAMFGSYGPSADSYMKQLETEESPSGAVARAGNYSVRSRLTDDDGTVFADFEWSYKVAKEW